MWFSRDLERDLIDAYVSIAMFSDDWEPAIHSRLYYIHDKSTRSAARLTYAYRNNVAKEVTNCLTRMEIMMKRDRATLNLTSKDLLAPLDGLIPQLQSLSGKLSCMVSAVSYFTEVLKWHSCSLNSNFGSIVLHPLSWDLNAWDFRRRSPWSSSWSADWLKLVQSDDSIIK